jgi:hypothetical protein
MVSTHEFDEDDLRAIAYDPELTLTPLAHLAHAVLEYRRAGRLFTQEVLRCMKGIEDSINKSLGEPVPPSE